MSQSATLYRIASTDFSKIDNDPENFELFKVQKGHETFQGTHEGLRFVLSKNEGVKPTGVVNSIFGPAAFVGEEPYAADPEIYIDDEPVYYHHPDKVKEIAAFLNAVSIEKLRAAFNPAELNDNGIYPWQWSAELLERHSFNLPHLTEDFSRLKELFAAAAKEEEYVLSFVG